MQFAFSRLLPPPLVADWHNPLLFSWPVADAALDRLLPPGLELDRWEHSAYVSLVGLRFDNVRVFGVPAPQRAYDEINLRFYVRRRCGVGDMDGRPGVVFVRQLVPHRLTALAARVMYGEPFETVPTGHKFYGYDSSGMALPACVAYHWDGQGRRQQFWASSDDAPVNVAPGSLEEFLTCRYWGYNGKPGARVRTYRLTRTDWPVRRASHWGIDCDLSDVCDTALAAIIQETPASVLLATGSQAAVGLSSTLPG